MTRKTTNVTANLAGDRIRAVLKRNFADSHFYVRRRDRVRSIRYVIYWTDGPSEDAVQSIALPCIRDVPLGSIYCSRYCSRLDTSGDEAVIRESN